MPPPCLDCMSRSYRPCAPNNVFGPALLADARLEYLTWFDRDQARAEQVAWSFLCLFTLVQDDPERAFEVILHMVERAQTKDNAIDIGCGDLEDLIATHGAAFVDRIETLARRSPRFRWVLSGVWPQGKADTPVWARIAALQAAGPHMDRGDDLPPPDGLN